MKRLFTGLATCSEQFRRSQDGIPGQLQPLVRWRFPFIAESFEVSDFQSLPFLRPARFEIEHHLNSESHLSHTFVPTIESEPVISPHKTLAIRLCKSDQGDAQGSKA